MSGCLQRLKDRARRLSRETYAVYLAARHPRTPLMAKLLAGGVAAYALSPIDLIPDFVPVLGYLDDLLLLPAGIALALRMIPPDVMQECRERAAVQFAAGSSIRPGAAAVVVVTWILGAIVLASCIVQVSQSER